jgi:hypothetical protein
VRWRRRFRVMRALEERRARRDRSGRSEDRRSRLGVEGPFGRSEERRSRLSLKGPFGPV